MSLSPHATVIGGNGFVGRHLVHYLRDAGWRCDEIPREDKSIPSEACGHIFYCAGLTADFRERPFDTIEAHVSYLAKWLQSAHFDSLTYLSSTRVYANAVSTSEAADLCVNPNVAGDLYNLSKLMGESLSLQSGRPVHIVRLSNVYGGAMPEQNFLADILRAAVSTNHVLFRSAPDSEKDYISVQEVVRALARIALSGDCGVINLASGKNTSNQMIADCFGTAGVLCTFEENAPVIKFPRIETQKLDLIVGGRSSDLVQDLPSLLQHYGEAI